MLLIVLTLESDREEPGKKIQILKSCAFSTSASGRRPSYKRYSILYRNL